MHPPFEIKSFEEMKKKEAQQHFEWYISEIPSRIQLKMGTVRSSPYDKCLEF